MGGKRQRPAGPQPRWPTAGPILLEEDRANRGGDDDNGGDVMAMAQMVSTNTETMMPSRPIKSRPPNEKQATDAIAQDNRPGH